jgi:arylsulfatase A-like enzyme
MNQSYHKIKIRSICLLLSVFSTAFAQNQRPNIVFILSDDQPYKAQSSVDPWFSTPNIDLLAEESVVFNNAFVTSSVCCVSRASFFTGQHSVRNGIASFDTPLQTEQLQQSYSGILRDAGYRTAFLGKYGIGHTRSGAPKELCLPADQFDLWYGFQQSPNYWQMVDGEKKYLTTAMEEKAIKFIKETPKDDPFLLIMCLPEPHGQAGPWNYHDPHFTVETPKGLAPKPESMTQAAYDRLPQAIKDSKNNYVLDEYKPSLSMSYEKYMETVRDYTARTDLAVGKIRQALKDLGLDENTIVIFASDNGSMWGAHGIEGKWNMYEESIRVPMMIHDPRLKKSNKGKREQMVLNIDVASTIVDMAGLPIPEQMQGMSLLPIVNKAKTKGRTDWYYEHEVQTRSKGKDLPKCEGVRTERWKYIRYKDTQPVQEELFDLKKDPLEMNNLAMLHEHKETLIKLRKRCDDLRVSLSISTN